MPDLLLRQRRELAELCRVEIGHGPVAHSSLPPANDLEAVPGKRAMKVRADVKPGVKNLVRSTADEAGRFNFHCDLFCGSGHEDMAGTLVVVELEGETTGRFRHGALDPVTRRGDNVGR